MTRYIVHGVKYICENIMAEVHVSSKVNISTKKMRNESNNGKNKKISSLFKTQDSEDVIILKEDATNIWPKSVLR